MSPRINLFQSLESQGWGISDVIIPGKWQEDLYQEGQEYWLTGRFHEASIGREGGAARHGEIRGDSIFWLDAHSKKFATQRFVAWAAVLRHQLNHHFFLSLKSEEFHFARYPVGEAYRKHLDQHHARLERKISLVLYLNPQWTNDDGGELCLYSPDNNMLEVNRIVPHAARLVLFRSDIIPHEVLPSRQIRWTLSGWFRTDANPV